MLSGEINFVKHKYVRYCVFQNCLYYLVMYIYFIIINIKRLLKQRIKLRLLWLRVVQFNCDVNFVTSVNDVTFVLWLLRYYDTLNDVLKSNILLQFFVVFQIFTTPSANLFFARSTMFNKGKSSCFNLVFCSCVIQIISLIYKYGQQLLCT